MALSLANILNCLLEEESSHFPASQTAFMFIDFTSAVICCLNDSYWLLYRLASCRHASITHDIVLDIQLSLNAKVVTIDN